MFSTVHPSQVPLAHMPVSVSETFDPLGAARTLFRCAPDGHRADLTGSGFDALTVAPFSFVRSNVHGGDPCVTAPPLPPLGTEQ